MNPTYVVTVKGDRVFQVRRDETSGRPGEVVTGVCTVREVCRRLGKSRRQVYRYLRTGRLAPYARVLGQWLFSDESIAQWSPSRHRLPRRFQAYFWDTELSTVSPERHRAFILGRVLEYGDRDAIRWVLRTYPKPVMVEFLRGRGKAVLSPRTWHFWAAHVGLGRHRPLRSHWGGRP